MKLHRKQLGSIGVLRVAAHLMSQGYSVFTERGDLSRVDLIVLVENQPIKVQVKTRNLKDGKIVIDSRKSGPGYMYRYQPEDIDIFAVYIPEKDLVLFLEAGRVLQAKSTTVIRVERSKNNQVEGIHWFEDFLEFGRALRDHTQSTRPSEFEG